MSIRKHRGERVIDKRLRIQEAARECKNAAEWRRTLALARKALGRRVREMRAGKGWSQKEFARLCGIYRSSLGRIERGDHNLQVSTIMSMARCLEIEASCLVRGITWQ